MVLRQGGHPITAGQPRVSITIPSYNHARFLPTAIESALGQTYGNLEIVIVDDGSADGSLRIAKAYAARHPDVIRVFTHPGHAHRGMSATINLCFERTTGLYWSRLDSDDALHPLKVEEQVRLLESRHEVGWVYCHALCVDEQGRRRPERGLQGHDITRARDPLAELIRGNVIPGDTVLARRALVAQTGPFDERLLYSDWDFWIRLAARQLVAFMPRARVFYRVHGHNVSDMPGPQRLHHRVEVLLKLRREENTLGGVLALPRTRALIELETAYLYSCLEDERAARGHLHAALSIDPALRSDVGYFVEWLESSRRRPAVPAPATGRAFAWILDSLPADIDELLRAALKKSVERNATGSWAHWRGYAAAHWTNRRRVLLALIRDPRGWRDRALLAAYLEGLVGGRLTRRLRRLNGRRAHEQRT